MRFGRIELANLPNRNEQINMEHVPLFELDQSARQAATDGFYFNQAGEPVEWSLQINNAVESTVSIPPDRILKEPVERRYQQTNITIENITTTSAAKALHDEGKKPLALNFANGYTPGGGFLYFGCRAQEEVLCRMSALYQTLEKDPMYEVHCNTGGTEGSSWAILSPDVPVFRDDNYNALDAPWPLSFISCAAPEADSVGQPRSTTLLRKRIHRVLEIAESYGYSSLVLGAWGCGAFGNNPQTTALDFKYALQDKFRGAFETVVFAIYDVSGEGENITAFKDAF